MENRKRAEQVEAQSADEWLYEECGLVMTFGAVLPPEVTTVEIAPGPSSNSAPYAGANKGHALTGRAERFGQSIIFTWPFGEASQAPQCLEIRLSECQRVAESGRSSEQLQEHLDPRKITASGCLDLAEKIFDIAANRSNRDQARTLLPRIGHLRQ